MADKAKGPVMLLIILLIVAIAAAFLGFIGLQKEKQNSAILSEKIEGLEEKRRTTEKENITLKQKIDDLNQELSKFQAKIQDFDVQITSLNSDLASEKKAREDALSEAESLRNIKLELEAKLKINEEKINNLNNELTSIKGAKQELERKLKDLEAKGQDVQLDRIVVTGKSESASGISGGVSEDAAQLEGKVLVVNKEYDFIVVNLGQKDNVNIGDKLEVLHLNKKIGEVKIEEVRDTMSVAIPLAQDLVNQISEDDKVVYKKG